MNRNEQQMYSDIASIRKSLEKIANALDNKVLDNVNYKPEINPADLCNVIKDEYETDGTSVGNGKYEDEYTYEPNPNRDKGEPALIEYKDNVKNDSDYDIRVAASNFEEDYTTKKDAILDYVDFEFGSEGAKYTDIIKFAYYLGAPNAPKYDATRDRGYYAMAFNTRFNGHLVQGGKDFLVKGINKNCKERYFTHSNVNNFTDYYKRIQ